MGPTAFVVLVACTSKDLRAATRYEDEDRLLEAALVWVAAVERDLDDYTARHRLELIQQRAWDAEVQRAEAATAVGDPERALAVWRGLAAFRERLAGIQAPHAPAADEVGAAVAKAEEAVARYHYDAGTAAATASRWDVAITEFQAARAVRPEYLDTTPRIAAALAAQGDLDRASGRFAEALQHYDQAYALSGDDGAQRWATAIRAAWGRSDLAAGRCRAAFDELTAALAVDPSVGYDLERARQCARVELVVAPAEDLTGAAPAGLSVAGLLTDKLTADLRARGSAHVRLLDAAAPPPPGPGRRYTIRTRVTEVNVTAQDATAERSAAGLTQVTCDSLSSDTFVQGVGYVCDADVLVTWTETTRTQRARVAGTVRWYGADGVELASEAFEGVETKELRWAGAYRVDGVEVKRGATPGPGQVALPGEAPATAPPSSDAPDPALVPAAVAQAADAASSRVLGRLDAPDPPTPPGPLNVRGPIQSGTSPPAPVEDGRAEPM